MNNHLLPPCICGVIMLSGCALPDWGTSLPEKRPLGAELGTYRPSGTGQDPPWKSRPEIMEPEGRLTLRQALALALVRSPELASFAWGVREAEAGQLQAAALPNPEVEAEWENFGGTGEFQGTRALETTISLSQLIELGGKREKRLDLARMDSRLAGWDYEQKRIRVLTNVTRLFVEVLAAQEKLALARESRDIARQTRCTVEKRIAAGKSPPPEKSKADIEAAAAGIRVQMARRRLAAAKHALAAAWGARDAGFQSAAGKLAVLEPLPDPTRLVPLLSQNPGIARWEAEIDRRRAALELAKAGAVPDVTASVGYRHARETAGNDRAILAAVSVPVPIFNANRGEISRAGCAVIKAGMDRRAAEIEGRAKLEEIYQKLAAAYAEAVSLRDEVLPAARRSFDASSKSFELGKTNYLDVLDAQRTLVGIREQFIESLAAYHAARAEIEGLIGQPLDSVSESGKQAKGENNVNK